MAWYAAYVGAGKEARICKYVREHLPKGIEVVVAPTMCNIKVTSGGAVVARRNLYPGYIFLCVAEMTAEVYHQLKKFSVVGVKRILHQCAIPEQEMGTVLGHLENEITISEDMCITQGIQEVALPPEVKPSLSPAELYSLIKIRILSRRAGYAPRMRQSSRLLLLPAGRLKETGLSFLSKYFTLLRT